MKRNNFLLYSSCIPVRGVKRSVVCDLQRGRVSFIPNDLYEILSSNKGRTIEEIYELYGEENHQTISEYFDFLSEKEFGFWCSSSELNFFPELNLEFRTPNIIDNAIIDIKASSNHDFDKIFTQFEVIGNLDVQIRIYDEVNIRLLSMISDASRKKRINSLQFILKYSPQIDNSDIRSLITNNLKITLVLVHSSPFDKEMTDLITHILYTKESIESEKHCGIISPSLFSVNIPLFTEAQHYNTCLNKKISIDSNGEIKNCPSCSASFGSIENNELTNIVATEEFRKLWAINKDSISICKDCEFRYICTDCRAYLAEPSDILSKPLKCGYDPFTVTWNDWSQKPLNSNAIEFYHLESKDISK